MSPVGWAEKKGGHTVQDEGADLPAKDDLDFQGAGVIAANVGGATVVTIPGGIAVLPDHDHTGDPGDGNTLPTYSPVGHDHNAAYYTEAEVDDLISAVSVSPTGSFLLEGGNVVWESGLQFRVSAARYYIESVLYESIEQTITLDAADPADDRIDVIALDITETVVAITGTPAASPSRPDVDPATQLHLTFVFVPAGSATPGDVATDILYQENLGSPTEWAATASGAAVNVNSSNNPRTGTKDVEFTAAGSTDWLNLATATSLNLANYEQLVLYIRSKAAWASQKSLRISWRASGVVVGSYVSIDDGLYGFSSAVLGAYQQISIPLSLFAVSPSQVVNSLRIEVRGGGGAVGFYVDDMFLQGGVPQGAVGITIEEADARYVKKVDNITSIAFVIDGGGAEIADGIAGDLEISFDCTIVAWTLLADQSGAIVIDIWKEAYAAYPPTDADSITAGSEPEIAASGDKAQDTDLSDWADVIIVAGETLRYNVDSCTTIERVTLILKVIKA